MFVVPALAGIVTLKIRLKPVLQTRDRTYERHTTNFSLEAKAFI